MSAEPERMSPSKRYMSIGEVLKLLAEEFADVSISKIRFLETEGLIEPERTPSGYRKFYEGDVARLRYILRLQRDQFMPLKVIRKRLEHFDPSEMTEPPAAVTPVPAPPAAATQTTPARQEREPAETARKVPVEDDEFARFDGGLSMSFDEFVRSTGLPEDRVRELEEFGLIDAHPLPDGSVFYDEDDLAVAKMSKDFAKFGLEPRHLKMYKVFADKEAGFFEQIISPRGRGGSEGKRATVQSITELARLSKRLKHLLLKASLRGHLDS